MSRLLEDENLIAAEINEIAPDFTLRNERGETWRLSDNLGKVVTLLFYPGNETLVCTRQLCSVREHWAEYLASGAEIVGVSPATEKQNLQFAEHHNLPLSLLADIDGNVTKTYSQHWCLPSWMTRTLVIVDAKGIIRCRKIMLRAFRPTDKAALAAIYTAQYDVLSSLRKS